MKKIFATGALLASQFIANGQKTQITPTVYTDLSSQNNRSVSTYQYNKSGLNHAIGGVFGNIGENFKFRALGQIGNYVESNYVGADGGNSKYIHDLNFSIELGVKNEIKIEGGIFGGSPIGQPSIIPINIQQDIDSTTIPTSIITNGLLNTWTQLSENTPYYISGIFVSKHSGMRDIKVGLTNGAQHIKDNNKKLGGFSGVQFTDKNNNTYYACYHISDESIEKGQTLMHHIFEGHSVLKIHNINLVPALYFVQNKDHGLYGGNITASKLLKKNTQVSMMGEFNHNPQEATFNGINQTRAVIELQRVLGFNDKLSAVIAGSVGGESVGANIKPTVGVSIKTLLQR